jgi:predicted small lipoprotein YifL
MLKRPQILASAFVLAAGAVALPGCGQKGPLYLPTEPAAAQRATLPQTLIPGAQAPAPAPAAASPTPTAR